MPTHRRLIPELKRYDWGDREFIAGLLRGVANSETCAEAWFGAHPSAPSRIEGGSETLHEAIRSNPEGELGRRVSSKWWELPFLLKVLSAERPLSVQVHPTAEAAALGFREEEEAGVALHAPQRSFKDPHHKPELVVALTPFEALCGFARAAGRRERVESAPEIACLFGSSVDSPAGLRESLERYYAEDDEKVEAALRAWLHRIRAQGPKSPVERRVLEVHAAMESSVPDRGLVFFLLLENVRLLPGQALFLPAGVPHAYLRGAAVEIMANSDNVLRAGLTKKHVDPQRLLQLVRFEAGPPVVFDPIPQSNGVYTYPVPAVEFGLDRLELDPGQSFELSGDGPELLLSVSPATAKCSITGDETPWQGGECLAVPNGVPLRGEADTRFIIYRAYVPNHTSLYPDFRGRRPRPLSFGTSGLRGKVDDLTDLEVYVNVTGFLGAMVARGLAVAGSAVLIAGDLRPSTHSPTRSIMRAVSRAIADMGMEVVNLGNIPTPALTLEGIQRGCPSIMVTGSHIPFDRNGLKFNTPTGELLKSEEQEVLDNVARSRTREYRRLSQSSLFDDQGYFKPETAVHLPGPRNEARDRYLRRYSEAFAPDSLSGLSVVLYQHSAVGRDLLLEILSSLGAQVLPLGRATSFVPIDTEALGQDGLATLQTLADEARESGHSVDAVVSTDGDSDRPLLATVDDEGCVMFVGGDVLGVLVAKALAADAVAVPVSATDMIETIFDPDRVRRTRIGSPHVISTMAAMKGRRVVGWEANGGFLVASSIETAEGVLEPLPTRDAALPLVVALQLARQAKERESSLAQLVSDLPSRQSRASLLDGVDPDRMLSLMHRFEMPRSSLRGALRTKDGFEGFGEAGEAMPLSHEDEVALSRVWSRLSQVFKPEDGFHQLQAVDTLDGLRCTFTNRDVAHVRPSGNAPQLRIYAQADEAGRADEIIALALAEGGLLTQLLVAADATRFCEAVLGNIALCNEFLEGRLEERPASMIGVVCGSMAAQSFWQRRLDLIRADFGATSATALFEDLPVNQAFGLLLLWERARPHFVRGRGALFAFVFGSGTRATPITETECGQKPAIDSFAAVGGSQRRASLVELALRSFAAVEGYLRRSGFEGFVVKWGDEVQIPTLDLSGTDERLAGADVVRFVSMQTMTEDTAANKDWVGVADDGRITAFIPRRPLAEMQALADAGLLQVKGKRVVGGVNLGSIAMSSALADILLEAFESDVHEQSVDRSERPDLDPQLFSALCIANLPASERQEAWRAAQRSAPAVADLASKMPDILDRLVGALDAFERRHGRPVKIMALDFGDQYWGDIGQHGSMYQFFMDLCKDSVEGTIARALAGLPDLPDAKGNWISGNTKIGREVEVEGSVLIDAQIEAGDIRRSVLIGTRAGSVTSKAAFDVGSTAPNLVLEARSGGYKVISTETIKIPSGERCTSVFSADGETLMRVHEDTNLRDKPRTYNAQVAGNPMSFRDAHQRAVSSDPQEVEARRERARRLVIGRLETKSI